MRKFGIKGRYGGALKLLILYSLKESPSYAYALMRKIEDLTGFKPSSGAFFPLLRHLERHGLIESEEVDKDGRRVKVYRLSRRGLEFLEAHQPQVQESLRLAKSFKKFNEMGCSRIFRVIGELVENIDKLNESQLEELRRAVLDFEYRVLGILKGDANV
ncbi:MAG: PadR family transcriptional regulator [Infirmifilum sp.]